MRYVFADENDQIINNTGWISSQQQFFFGYDITTAIALLTVINMRNIGDEYFIVGDDVEFSRRVSKISPFEMRIPNELVIDNNTIFVPINNTQQRNNQSWVEKVNESNQEKFKDNYQGIVYE